MKCPSCASEVPGARPECPSCGAPLSPSRDERIEELLGRYIEQLVTDGSPADPETLCRESPELLEPLREHIREYERLHQMLARPSHLEAGTVVLHYRILGKLGAGGMGEVYLAEDTKLERRVALKIVSPKMAGDPLRLRRFLREARLEAGLNHPNVVTVYSVEEAEGLTFLTMEVVEGKTLKELIPSRGLDPERILRIAVQMADALVAAHERGIMHRDLKPANVMMTEDGRVKVLDFGLAKLRQPPPGTGEAITTRTLTAGGKILGTLPYMSPEQIQSTGVDLRTDIFSFGVILYEMATGRGPFEGANMAKLISSIMRDNPAPVTVGNPRVPPALGRLIERCLEKDPEKRYASSRELRDELAALCDEFTSKTTSRSTVPAVFAPLSRRRRYVAGGLLAALITVAAYVVLVRWNDRPAPEPPEGAARRPSTMAVLYFDNMSSDPELDWLHTGITDMLVTDLSQSPEIEVLSTSRLHQIMKDLEVLGESSLSFDELREVAAKAGVETILRGSFARIGTTFRITFTLEDMSSGRILKSNRVEGLGEGSLFSMVDELSASIRKDFEVMPHPEIPESIEAVTTSSVEAWRFYTEALALHRESKSEEAIALLEKAVEIDPSFSLAFVSLGAVHKNLAHTSQARQFTARAVELSDHLPLDLRLTVRAAYYGTRWATLGRAIEIFEQELSIYPYRNGSRNNLANRYAELERYEDAVREFKNLVDRGEGYPGNYTGLANSYAALGQFETGYQVLSEYARTHPDDWLAQMGLGWHLTEWGKLDEALGPFHRAAALRPEKLESDYGLWRVYVLKEDWEKAELAAVRILGHDDLYGRWRGAVSQSRNQCYKGRSEEALARFDDAIRVHREPDAFTALAHCWKAELLLQRGEAVQALTEAELAQALGKEQWPELKGLFLEALAYGRLNQASKANQLEETLRQRFAKHPNVVEKRQLLHLSGLLALSRGEPEAAVSALEQAESLLPEQGVEFHWHVYPDHVPIWYALGQAQLTSGRPAEALPWFQKAVTSGGEHLESPVPYVRSFYFLGTIYRQIGDAAQARHNFERFVEFWREGDLDPGRLQEARSAITQ